YARSVLCSSPRIVTFFVQAEYGIRAFHVTGVQTCALPIFHAIHHHRDHACALVEMAQRSDSALTRECLSACRFCTRDLDRPQPRDRKSTRLNSSHVKISYAVFCLKKKKNTKTHTRHTSYNQ